MKQTRRIFITARSRMSVLAALLFASLIFTVFDVSAVHAIEEKMGRRCVTCHVGESDDVKSGKETFFVPSGIEREQGAEAMCFSCHNGSVMDSRASTWTGHQHPIGVTPAAGTDIPKDLPLTEDNKLYCGTCHSPHEPTIEMEGRFATNMRKSIATDDACALCHRPEESGGHLLGKLDAGIPMKIILTGGWAGPQKNKLSCRTCHRPHGSPEKELLIRTKDSICEDCHGSNPSKELNGPGMDSHPVRVKVSDEILHEKLPSGKRLVSGKGKEIICLTCHKTHRPEVKDSLLVRGNRAGELCIHCHARYGGKGIKKDNNGNHPLIENAEAKDAAKRGCNICHRTHNGARDPFAAPGKSHILSAPMANSELCAECHKGLAAFGEDDARRKGTHPVGVWAETREPVSGGGFIIERERISCRSCHLSHGTEPGYSSLKEHRSFSCLHCHSDQNSLPQDTSLPGNHPVYVGLGAGSVPQEFLAAGGSLGEHDELVCQTCHDVHRAEQSTPLLLKPALRKDYCIGCHQDKALLLGAKHDLNVSAPDLPNKFDESPKESGACGVCHRTHGWARDFDPHSATASGICSDCHYEGSSVAEPVGPHSHPTGTVNGDRTNTYDLPLFSFLGKRSVSGNVACATCHDVHRETIPRLTGEVEKNFLRLPYRGENLLCINCHNQKASISETSHYFRQGAVWQLFQSVLQGRDKGVCAPCHSPHKGAGRLMWSGKGPGTYTAVLTLCTNCHFSINPEGEKLPQPSHPTEVALAVGMDSDLPLYDSSGRENPHGLITCATCHDTHGEENEVDLTGSETAMPAGLLREIEGAKEHSQVDRVTAICIHCHEEQESVLGTPHDLNKGVCGGCHSSHPDSLPLLWADRLKDDADPISAACLSCHGSLSRRDQPLGKAHSHSVGIAPRASIVTGLPTFDEAGKQDPEGVITCATCHTSHEENTTAGGTGTMEGRKFGRVAGNPDQLCIRCHPEKENIRGTVHDLARISPGQKNILGQTVAEKGICSACHIPHFAGDDSALWAREYGPGEDVPSRYCLGCHGEEGLAKKENPQNLWHPKAKVATDKITAAQDAGEKSFGNILKNILVGPTEPERKGMRVYTSKPMKFVDRLSSSRKTAPLLPLYDDKGRPGHTGFLSCPSCHDIHNSEAKVRKAIFKDESEREEFEKNLIRTSFIDEAVRLCGDCHGPYRLSVFWGFHSEERGKHSGRIYKSEPRTRF